MMMMNGKVGIFCGKLISVCLVHAGMIEISSQRFNTPVRTVGTRILSGKEYGDLLSHFVNCDAVHYAVWEMVGFFGNVIGGCGAVICGDCWRMGLGDFGTG